RTRHEADDLGVGPFLKSAAGLLEIAENLDLASIKQFKAGAKQGFTWIMIEPDTVRLVGPATPGCAQQIGANPKIKDRVKEMRKFVEPIDVQPCEDGLAIVLGKKGQAIRLTYIDTRPYRACDEQALARCAGSPRAIILDDGKPANADRLIQQFIAEKTKKG